MPERPTDLRVAYEAIKTNPHVTLLGLDTMRRLPWEPHGKEIMADPKPFKALCGGDGFCQSLVELYPQLHLSATLNDAAVSWTGQCKQCGLIHWTVRWRDEQTLAFPRSAAVIADDDFQGLMILRGPRPKDSRESA